MVWRGMSAAKVIWILLFIGFAIKVPVFPFHTWLPLAHVEAPTAISVILAGILLKLGVYGIIRINYGIMPDTVWWFAGGLAFLGLVNVIWGAMCMYQRGCVGRILAVVLSSRAIPGPRWWLPGPRWWLPSRQQRLPGRRRRLAGRPPNANFGAPGTQFWSSSDELDFRMRF